MSSPDASTTFMPSRTCSSQRSGLLPRIGCMLTIFVSFRDRRASRLVGGAIEDRPLPPLPRQNTCRRTSRWPTRRFTEGYRRLTTGVYNERQNSTAAGRPRMSADRPDASAAAKVPFDVDVAMRAIREAVRPFPKAALFELAHDGFTTPFEQLVACMI